MQVIGLRKMIVNMWCVVGVCAIFLLDRLYPNEMEIPVSILGGSFGFNTLCVIIIAGLGGFHVLGQSFVDGRKNETQKL